MKKISKLLAPISLCLAAIALAMIFLPAVVEGTGDSAISFSGLQVVFGYSETNGNLTYNYTAFSFMNLLPYILLLAGIVLLGITMGGKKIKFVYVITTCLFVVAAVLLFLSVTFVVPATNLGGYINGISKEDCVLGIGSILAGIFSILAGCATGIKLTK